MILSQLSWLLAAAKIILLVLVGILIGLAAYTFNYAEGDSYFSKDPKACMNCHIMRSHFDSWQKASHHAAANCVDCHMPKDFVPKYVAKAENGFWHSVRFTLQDFHEPIQITPKNAKILQNNCIDCHQDLVGDIVHNGYLNDQSKTMDCVHCHAEVGHGPRK